MVTATSSGPRASARRQRAASHIRAMESGPPETASTIAGAAFQSANRSFAWLTEIAEWSSSGMGPTIAFSTEACPALSQPKQSGSALYPLLLAVDGGLHAARGTRIFPRHFAESGAGGFLFLQRRQRLAEPQQGIRRLGGLVELGGHAEEGFRSIAVLLTLEIAFTKPILRIRNQRIAWIFLHEALHGLFG